MAGIQTLHDTGTDATVLSKYDGGVYGTAIGDCVCSGIGDEFTLSYSTNTLQVNFEAGSEAIIGGSFFKLTSRITVDLSKYPNSTIYLCASINLSKANLERGSFECRTSTSMQSDNLNGSGTIRDLLLYVITTGTSGVTAVEDKRVIKGNDTAISGLGLKTMTTTEYDALTTKDANTLYFTYDAS